MIPNITWIIKSQSYHLCKINKLKIRLLHRSAFCADKNKNSTNGNNGSEHSVKRLLDSASAFVDTKSKCSEDEWTTLPYAEGTVLSKQERVELDVVRSKIDPRDTSIILFPGQGSQFVGMAKSLKSVPVARDLFDFASEILNYDLMELCNKGPIEQLNDIRYSHAAIMTTSLANLEVLREERPDAVLNCVATAGFSLGEITALVFSGALQFDQALQLVELRAEAIHVASEIHKGGMASIFYRPDSDVMKACKKAKEWCLQNDIKDPECIVSNFMFPRYKVLSGNEEALQYIENNLKKFRIGSIKRIQNTPACHSKLMEPTIEPITESLKYIHIADPLIRVYANVTGKPYVNANHIKKLLPKQLIRPVRWEQIMHNLYARRRGEYFPRTFVCGPNSSLKSILKNVNLRAFLQTIHIGDYKK